MTEIFIKDLKSGQKVNGTYALRARKLLPFRDRSGHYLAVVLSDKTGQIEGRAWESAYEIYHSCHVGDLVKVQGQVMEYSGKAQIQVSAITVCQDTEVDTGRFVPSNGLDPKTVSKKILLVIDSLKDIHLKSLLALIFSDEVFFRSFIAAPAAKYNHHAAIGGLFEHSIGIVSAAERIAEAYPQLDRDLLIVGALLHDMGKVEEYKIRTAIDFTDEGRLLGHIVLGVRLLDQYISQLVDFPENLRLKLTHLIISHHGQYEWQSPKRPKFLEAAVLHHLDMIDAQVNMFSFAVENRENEDNSWTGWIKGLDRYVFCR